MPESRTITIPLVLDTEALRNKLAVMRMLCSHIGFALDTAILALDETEGPHDA